MRLGVHCSVRRGFSAALRHASSLGCETLQILSQSPHDWKNRFYTDEEFAEFRRLRITLALDPLVVHATFQPNLSSSNEAVYQRSARALREDLIRCEKLAADYLVIHPGAFSPHADVETGLRRLVAVLRESLEIVPGNVRLLIETMAGGGRRLGGRFAEIREILEGVPYRRPAVCFDTCHVFGAGKDLSSEGGLFACLAEFDHEIGLGEIKAFHVNDSAAPLGSHLDRHQHLGRGHIGLEGFRRLFSRQVFRDCSLILETPHVTAKDDVENLAQLKSCLG